MYRLLWNTHVRIGELQLALRFLRELDSPITEKQAIVLIYACGKDANNVRLRTREQFLNNFIGIFKKIGLIVE